MQQVEYTTLLYRGLGRGRAWFEDGERVGSWEELTSILNLYASRGWVVLTTGGGSDSPFIILERPFEGRTLVPADAPAGRGDGPTPMGLGFARANCSTPLVACDNSPAAPRTPTAALGSRIISVEEALHPAPMAGTLRPPVRPSIAAAAR